MPNGPPVPGAARGVQFGDDIPPASQGGTPGNPWPLRPGTFAPTPVGAAPPNLTLPTLRPGQISPFLIGHPLGGLTGPGFVGNSGPAYPNILTVGDMTVITGTGRRPFGIPTFTTDPLPPYAGPQPFTRPFVGDAPGPGVVGGAGVIGPVGGPGGPDVPPGRRGVGGGLGGAGSTSIVPDVDWMIGTSIDIAEGLGLPAQRNPNPEPSPIDRGLRWIDTQLPWRIPIPVPYALVAPTFAVDPNVIVGPEGLGMLPDVPAWRRPPLPGPGMLPGQMNPGGGPGAGPAGGPYTGPRVGPSPCAAAGLPETMRLTGTLTYPPNDGTNQCACGTVSINLPLVYDPANNYWFAPPQSLGCAQATVSGPIVFFCDTDEVFRLHIGMGDSAPPPPYCAFGVLATAGAVNLDVVFFHFSGSAQTVSGVGSPGAYNLTVTT